MRVVSTVEGDVGYWLTCYDEKGRERREGDGGLLSRAVLDDVARRGVTDVFFVSHGWKGDVPRAIEQYDAWIAATALCRADRARARAERPGFEPAVVGLHWPSLPWGDESLPEDQADAADVESLAAGLGDTPQAREALATILARDAAFPDQPPDHATAEALRLLERTARAGDEREEVDPDVEDVFDPVAAVVEHEPAEDDVPPRRRGLKGLLRQFSYWKMKRRARAFGEGSAHALLREVQAIRPGLRCHVVGHSFGCIVAAGMIQGPAGSDGTTVHSATLVQGALSLWAFSERIPVAPRKKGYFHHVVRRGSVTGAVVTTQSRFDKAVGRAYPRATRLRGDVDFAADDAATFPKYGAIGAFGIQGVPGAIAGVLLPPDQEHRFARASIHNLDGDDVIKSGKGASGAHSDIAHPEVAHAMWAAALT